MDYLDPQKRLQHKVTLIIGYALIAVAILGGTVVLMLFAYGFGLGKNGQIIQNGLVFVSSQPNPANIYVNGKPSSAKTNTKLLLPAGRYTLRLQLPGYRPWQRSISVEGGDVQHFDYPLLFPQTLATSPIHAYSAAPSIATESPDRHWLVVAQPNSDGLFDMYDLTATSPAKSVQVLTVPATVFTKADASQAWQVVGWADDNQHVLLKHTFGGQTEFIELDTQNPALSRNLNTALAAAPSDITLDNQKYNQFYLYNAADHTLQTDSLNDPAPKPYLDHVLAYKPYGADTVLYVTDANAPAGKVEVEMRVGSNTYPIREITASPTYLLELASYSGPLYVVVGGSAENNVFIYKDPAGQQQAHPERTALAMRAMRITAPNYLAFSTTAQFILAENGTSVVVYDLQNTKSYTYTLKSPLDAPQAHVAWMDGDRLVYGSGGKLAVVDYDNTNQQLLMPISASYLPFFAPDFRHVYVLAPAPAGVNLTATPLVTP